MFFVASAIATIILTSIRLVRDYLMPVGYSAVPIRGSDKTTEPALTVGQFKESEGITLILQREQADAANLPYTSVFSMITLAVHSSLEAVGFLAAITSKLAQHKIAVNSVSAYYHDHLFVPVSQTHTVMTLLQEFSE